MQGHFCRKLVLSVVILVTLISNIAISYAMNVGEVVPNLGISSKVKLGEIAPDLNELLNSNQLNVKVIFNKKPVIIVAIHGYIDVQKLIAIQSFYERNKKVMDLYVISHMDKEQMDYFVKKYDIRVPYYFSPTTEFIKKFNYSSPSIIIIDQNRKVRYNSEYNIDIKALEKYMEKLIAGQTKEEPQFTYVPGETISSVPTPRYVNQPPVLLNIGEKINVEDFRGVNGEPVDFVAGKPTVLWFCLSISSSINFEMTLPLLESLRKDRGDRVNVYPVFDGADKKSINEIMNNYNYSMPVLKTYKNLAYSRSFPCLVIFDEQGILQYRSNEKIDLEKLEKNIDGLNSK